MADLSLSEWNFMNLTWTDNNNSTDPPPPDIQEINLKFMLFINILNCFLCVSGLAGNGLVLYVICRYSSMQTITNVFILALAIADIAYLLQIPFMVTTAILQDWAFGDFYCRIYYVITTMNQFASSFFLAVMSADRFIAICMPTTGNKIRTTKNAIITCCVVWSVALLCTFPVVLFTKTTSKDNQTNCNISWPDFHTIRGAKVFVAYCFTLGFFIPVVLMLLFYGLVIRKLKSRHEMRHHETASVTEKRRQHKIRKISALISAFLCCWTPYWVNQIYITFVYSTFEATSESSSNPSDGAKDGINLIYATVSLQCLCYANSAINPILYAMFSENFKKNYLLACGWFRGHSHQQIPEEVDTQQQHTQTQCLHPLDIFHHHRRTSSAREIISQAQQVETHL